LVATFCEEKLRVPGRWAKPTARAAGLLAACASSVAIVATVYLGGFSWGAACAMAALAFLSIVALQLGRGGDLRSLVAASAGMVALGWILWFSGPLAKNEVGRRSIRGPVEAALAIAGDRTVLLFNPSDGLRGAASFWRNRTTEEVRDPESFVRRLLEDPSAVALFHMTVREQFLEVVRSAFSQQGAEPVLEASFPVRDNRVVLLWGARPRAATPRGYVSSASP